MLRAPLRAEAEAAAHQCFRRWWRFGFRRAAVRAARGISLRAIASRALCDWALFARRRTAVRRLTRSAARPSAVQIARRCFGDWLSFLSRRRRRRALERRCEACALRRFFLTWRRRRFRSFQRARLRALRHEAQRLLARRCLRLWARRAARALVCDAAQRVALERLAKGFLARWQRFARVCEGLRRIGHCAYWRVARRAFGKWKAWLVRILRALRLEQRNAALVLHPHFAQWEIVSRVRRARFGVYALL